jgi:hypothetical protein
MRKFRNIPISVITDCYSQIFDLLLNKVPSEALIKYYIETGEHEEIQRFCVNEAKLIWVTGISILDAADNMVIDAIGNANIK